MEHPIAAEIFDDVLDKNKLAWKVLNSGLFQKFRNDFESPTKSIHRDRGYSIYKRPRSEKVELEECCEKLKTIGFHEEEVDYAASTAMKAVTSELGKNHNSFHPLPDQAN